LTLLELPLTAWACTNMSLKQPLIFVFKTVELTEWLVVFVDVSWVVLTQFWVKCGQTQPLGYIFKLHF